MEVGSRVPVTGVDDVLGQLVVSHQRLASLGGEGLDAALQALADEAVRFFGERCLVGLLEGDELVCHAAAGTGVPISPGDRIEKRSSLAGRAVETGQPQICHDAQDDDRVDADYNVRVNVRSGIHAPLHHAGQVLGNLSVLSATPYRFTGDDRNALVLLALAGAQAIAVAMARHEGRAARAQLADSRLLLGAARGVSGAAVWEWDLATGKLAWSPEMFRLTGVDPAGPQPSIDMWNCLLHPEDRDRCLSARALGIRSGEGYQQHFRILTADSHAVRHLHTWAQVEHGENGESSRVVGATIDVTELARLTRTDPSTGLFNRAVLDQELSAALPCCDENHQVALILCDLDRFKLVNDTLGHQAGDRLLAEVAARFMTSCPPGSLVARLGGDEFGVLLPKISEPQEARDVARSLVTACRRPFHLATAENVISTVTAGIAIAADPERDPGQVFREADLALYQAKEAGRDRWAVFDDTMRASVEQRVRTEDVLRTAMDAGRLDVLFQPVVCLRTGGVLGVEALGRIVDPELGVLSPDVFVRVAEETGLIVRLDHWVLEQSVRLASRWRPEGPSGDSVTPTVAVNFSPRTLEQQDVATVVSDVLGRSGTPGDHLLLEITEHSLLDRGTTVRRELTALRRMGVGVGMDDFGTGWSAMSYLVGLRLQFMKIDRSFVVRIGEGDEKADAVVKAIIDLGHAHGLVVIAEGVENERQAQRLCEMGCDQAQGWWFARPVPQDQLDEAVARWNARARAITWRSWRLPTPAAAPAATS